MSSIPQNPLPHTGQGRRLLSLFLGQRSQSPRAPPHTRVSCICFPDIRTAIALSGIIHLILQLILIFGYEDFYSTLLIDVKSRDLRYTNVFFFLMIYLIVNFAAGFSFLCVVYYWGDKATCSACYLIGLILNIITAELYWRNGPDKRDGKLDRSMIINSSVVIAVIYHVCGFVLIFSMIFEEKPGCCQRTGLDLESGLPVELPPTQNPSRVSPGIQQQSPPTPNPPTAIVPSTSQENNSQ